MLAVALVASAHGEVVLHPRGRLLVRLDCAAWGGGDRKVRWTHLLRAEGIPVRLELHTTCCQILVI